MNMVNQMMGSMNQGGGGNNPMQMFTNISMEVEEDEMDENANPMEMM